MYYLIPSKRGETILFLDEKKKVTYYNKKNQGLE